MQIAQHNHDNGISLGLKVLALVLVVLFRHPIVLLTFQELAASRWSGGGRPSSLAEDDHQTVRTTNTIMASWGTINH
jgi:hypothetical protein